MITRNNLLTLKDKIVSILLNLKLVFILFIVVTLIASIQKYAINQYSVYLIYKTAGLNLTALKNFYAAQPGLDYYLYSPTFAAFFLSFAYLPNLLGAVLWNLISIILLLIGINLLRIDNWKKSAICGIIFFEALTCLQNFQANVLATALMLLVFVAFEKNKFFWAALCVGLGFFTKITGVGFAILFLFYHKKNKFIIYFIISMVYLIFNTTLLHRI